MRLSRFSIKGASTKGLLFASKDVFVVYHFVPSEIIVSQFKDNASQCKISKNLGLSPSTVHNIVKRFRGNLCKGQGRKPLLNVPDHRAFRRYCLRNHHATMMDIATWAWWYFGKSLSLKTVHCCI